MRDLLNRKLKEEHHKSLSKTGAPFDLAPQTYFLDEQELAYNPATMAVGTHKQEVKEQMTAKHVLKQVRTRNNQVQAKVDNFYSKDQFVWNNEKSLEKVQELN